MFIYREELFVVSWSMTGNCRFFSKVWNTLFRAFVCPRDGATCTVKTCTLDCCTRSHWVRRKCLIATILYFFNRESRSRMHLSEKCEHTFIIEHIFTLDSLERLGTRWNNVVSFKLPFFLSRSSFLSLFFFLSFSFFFSMNGKLRLLSFLWYEMCISNGNSCWLFATVAKILTCVYRQSGEKIFYGFLCLFV